MRLFTSIKRSEESYLDQNEGESDDAPFPLDLEVVAREQKKDKVLVAKSKRDGQKIKKEVVQDVELITHEGKVYIPRRLLDDVLNWYHHYLQHLGESRMYKTISQNIYWPG